MDNQRKNPTTPMDPKIKAWWLEALRSGEYKQGTGYLRRGDKFCCLGVLCNLAVEAGAPKVEEDLLPDKNVSTYSGAESVLPSSVMEWAGLKDSDPTLVVGSGGASDYRPVSDFNDGGATFNMIADLIEAQL